MEELEEKFRKLTVKAKALITDGRIKESMELYKQAYKLQPNEKLAKKIKKMEAYLLEHGSDNSDEEEGDQMVHLGNDFYLYHELYEKLYQHQRDGILWMWGLFKKKRGGGILGDDMGLGKTIQVIAFLSGLFDQDTIKSVLIVLPVSLRVNWENEFTKWAPGIRVVAFHGGTKSEHERALDKVQRKGGVCLTSYGMLVNNSKQLAETQYGREFVWDYIILDEGHKIKNPSNKCSKGLYSIAANNRLILTGTPIQNNLKEMWALFNWTHQGALLGSAKTFGMEYEGPITRARKKDATDGEQRLGQEIAAALQKRIGPYFLRRTKAEVSKKIKTNGGDGDSQEKVPEFPTLTRKNDLIIWTFLSEIQQRIYKDFIHTPEVTQLLNTSKSPLTALVVLKKICDHPRLLTMRQCHSLGIEVEDSDKLENEDDEAEEEAKVCAASKIDSIEDEVLMNESGKLQLLINLVDNLKAEGHRCLIFSQSRKMLDIIQKILMARGHAVARLDGTVRLMAERDEIIRKFTENQKYSAFLLTTQVGGVGLTLTAADRVIIFDPSWNPATDAQAVDRAFRIGQDKNVVVYRLVTCGTVEEKIYRRQIFKDSVTRQATGDSHNPYRYFTRQELHELFVLDNPYVSTTQQQLAEIHANQRKSDTSLDMHIAFLHSLDIYGISDHDLMFSKEAHINKDSEMDVEQEYISQRVQRATNLIAMESDHNIAETARTGKYLAPEVFAEKKENPGRAPPAYQWPAGYVQELPETGTVDLTEQEDNKIKRETVAATSRQFGNPDQSLSNSFQRSSSEDYNFQGSGSPKQTSESSESDPIAVDDSMVSDDDSFQSSKGKVEDSDNSFVEDVAAQLPQLHRPTGREVKQEGETFKGQDSGDTAISKAEQESIIENTVNSSQHGDSKSEPMDLTPRKITSQNTDIHKSQVDMTPKHINADVENSLIAQTSMDVTPKKPVQHVIPGSPMDMTPQKNVRTVPAASPLCRTPKNSLKGMGVPQSPMDVQHIQEELEKSMSSMILDDEDVAMNSPVRNSALPALNTVPPSGEGRKSGKKKRRSVCITPGRRRTVVPDSDDEEEKEEPVVRLSPILGVDNPSAAESPCVVGDSDEENIAADDMPVNSTRLPTSSGGAYQPMDAEDYLESEESDEEDIVRTKRTRARLITDSDGESDADEKEFSGMSKKVDPHHMQQGESAAENVSDQESSEGMPQEDNTPAVTSNSAAAEFIEDVDEETTPGGAGNSETEEDEEEDAEEMADEEEQEEEEEGPEEEEEEEEEESEEEEELTEDQQQKYIDLMTRSRNLYKSGNFLDAFKLGVEALEIYRGDERACRYIFKLQAKAKAAVEVQE